MYIYLGISLIIGVMVLCAWCLYRLSACHYSLFRGRCHVMAIVTCISLKILAVVQGKWIKRGVDLGLMCLQDRAFPILGQSPFFISSINNIGLTSQKKTLMHRIKCNNSLTHDNQFILRNQFKSLIMWKAKLR